MPASEQRPSKITDEALLAAASGARNLRQLLLALGVAPYGGNYEVVRQRLRRLGIVEARFSPRKACPTVGREELANAVRESDSWAMAARRLGLTGSAAERRVKRLAVEAALDASHLLGQAWNRGTRLGGREPEPLRTLLVQGRYTSTSSLRRRLLREQLLEHRCAACERESWEGGPIPLELDHRNGDRSDNRLENLRLLCPNCHAGTETYRGRNIGASAGRSPAPPPLSAASDADRALQRLLALLGSAA